MPTHRLLSLTTIAAAFVLVDLPESRALTYTTDAGGSPKLLERNSDWVGGQKPPSGLNHTIIIAPATMLSATTPFLSSFVGGTSTGTVTVSAGATLSIAAGGKLAYSGTSPLNQTLILFSGSTGSVNISEGGEVVAPRIVATTPGALSGFNVYGTLTVGRGNFFYAPLAGPTAGGSNFLVTVWPTGIVNFDTYNFGQINPANLDRNRYALKLRGGRFIFTFTGTEVSLLATDDGRATLDIESGELDFGGREIYWVKTATNSNTIIWNGGTMSNVYGISTTGNGMKTSRSLIEALSTTGTSPGGQKTIDINNQRVSQARKIWSVGAASGTSGTIAFDIYSPGNDDSDRIAITSGTFALSNAVKVQPAFPTPVLDPSAYAGKTYALFTGSTAYLTPEVKRIWSDGLNTYYANLTGTLSVNGRINVTSLVPTQDTATDPSEPELFNDLVNPPKYRKYFPPPAVTATVSGTTYNVLDFGAVGDGASHPRDVPGQIGRWPSVIPAKRLQLEASYALIWEEVKDTSLSANTELPNISGADEADWVAIQAALIKARDYNEDNPNSFARVEIPPAMGGYLINRHVWIYSNTELEWTGTNPSFVRLTGQTSNGTAFSNENSWGFEWAANRMVRHIKILNPHVDAGGPAVPGENGISFGNGAEDITIENGVVKNAIWGNSDDHGFSEQGGRAFQFESGVKDVYVIGSKVENSSIGFSTACGLDCYVSGTYHPFRNKPPREGEPINPIGDLVRNIAWNINFTNVKIHHTDTPFVFGNLAYYNPITTQSASGAYETVNDQSATVSGATITDSGILRKNVNKSGTPKSTGDQSPIIALLGAKNLVLRDIHIVNSGTYSVTISGTTYNRIRAIVKGHGANLNISNLKFEGMAKSLFFIGDEGGSGSAASNNSRTKRLAIRNFDATGAAAETGLEVAGDIPATLLSQTVISGSHGTFTGSGSFLSPSLHDLNADCKKTIRIDVEPSGLHDTVDHLLP